VARIIPTLDQSDGSVYARTPEEKQLWVDLLVAHGYNPAGVARYRSAMQKSPPHHDLLGRIAAPTTIIHAAEDKSFSLEHGEDLARRIPGARFRAIAGAGHGMPVSLTPRLADLMIDHLAWSKVLAAPVV
jgi:pimeloyl-ACP methyl ester carboxylesterase